MGDVREATTDDIPALVRLRELLFTELADDFGPVQPGDGWRDACADALKQQIAGDTMRIVVVDGSTAGPVSCGMGAIEQRLPSPYNRGGLVGYIFGIVTVPGHRGQGHARAVMRDLIAWFDARGVERVDLHASAAGMPLYQSLGFAVHPEPTLSRKHPELHVRGRVEG